MSETNFSELFRNDPDFVQESDVLDLNISTVIILERLSTYKRKNNFKNIVIYSLLNCLLLKLMRLR